MLVEYQKLVLKNETTQSNENESECDNSIFHLQKSISFGKSWKKPHNLPKNGHFLGKKSAIFYLFSLVFEMGLFFEPEKNPFKEKLYLAEQFRKNIIRAPYIAYLRLRFNFKFFEKSRTYYPLICDFGHFCALFFREFLGS